MSRLFSDIIADILLRLPVKTLIRFRSASKCLCSLINCPDFIKAHLQRSIETKANKKLILCRATASDLSYLPWGFKLFATNFADGFKDIEELNLKLELKFQLGYVGSCNGLLLLSERSYKKHIIWNSFTNKHKIFQTPPNSNRLALWGLCYDDASRNYKVVRVQLESQSYKTCLYSLRSNSWERMEDLPCNYTVVRMKPMGKFVNGFLYWLCHLKLKNMRILKAMIVAFDVATNKLEAMPLPDHPSRFVRSELYAFEGKLCLSASRFDDGNNGKEVGLDLYVGERCEAGLNWSKMGTILYHNIPGVGYHGLKPLSYCEEEDRVLIYINGRYIIWFNLDKQEVKEIVEIPGIDCSTIYQESHDWLDYSTICWESLVSITD